MRKLILRKVRESKINTILRWNHFDFMLEKAKRSEGGNRVRQSEG